MNIKGKIVDIMDVQQVKETFKKREFVIEFAENAMYPEFIKFELVQDKVNLVDGFNVGAMVDVSFNLRGRSWVNQQGVKNYFNSLQAWRVVADSGMPQTNNNNAIPQGATNTAPIQDTFSANASNTNFDDDMPF